MLGLGRETKCAWSYLSAAAERLFYFPAAAARHCPQRQRVYLLLCYSRSPAEAFPLLLPLGIDRVWIRVITLLHDPFCSNPIFVADWAAAQPLNPADSNIPQAICVTVRGPEAPLPFMHGFLRASHRHWQTACAYHCATTKSSQGAEYWDKQQRSLFRIRRNGSKLNRPKQVRKDWLQRSRSCDPKASSNTPAPDHNSVLWSKWRILANRSCKKLGPITFWGHLKISTASSCKKLLKFGDHSWDSQMNKWTKLKQSIQSNCIEGSGP